MPEKSSPPPVDLEELLEREEGQFGWHQLRVMVLCAVATVCAALSTSEFIFTSSRVNTRCLIPECESSGSQQEFAPSWILNAVPSEGDGFASCERFNSSAAAADGTCPAALFDTTTIVDCEQHVYENTDSAVYTVSFD
uniref:Uncharacterized protein n=1 Tax=Pectinophora gossypiella TaxID=13191 RepID=A0A1E1WTW4_PECGO